MMNQREMLMYDDKYKKSVLAIMNIIANVKGSYNITGTDPLLYYKTLEDTIIKDMKNNKDIQKDIRLYKLIEKYLPALVYSDIYFGPNDISHVISADMLYNTNNKNSYSKITLNCTISAKRYDKINKYLTNIEISPSIKLSYNNITTVHDSNPLYVPKEYSDSFYQIYINTINSLNNLIEINYDIKSAISEIIDVEFILQEMAMLVTLHYMKAIISIVDYPKFLKLDEKKEDILLKDTENISLDLLKYYNEIGRNIFNIESSLYEIGATNLDLLKDTLEKINNIINESKNKIK